MKPASLLPLLLLLACGEGDGAPSRAEPREAPASVAPAPAPALPPLAAGEALALAPGADAAWAVREVAHAPRHFLASGWADGRTLRGLAGSTLVRVRVDDPEYAVEARGAWDAAPSPDGARLARLDERGVWVGAPGGEGRLLPLPRTLPGGEDLAGPPLWSPDGERLLVRWAGEGVPVFAVVEAASGESAPIEARGEGYLLVEPFAWLDVRRVLFLAQPRLGTDGGPPPRGDLAVYDRETGAHRRVTSVPEGVRLTPLAPWGGEGLLVAERRGEEPGRAWIYGVRDWSRRPAPLPAGERVAAHDTARAVVVTPLEETGGVREQALHLWDGERLTPLARVRGNGLRLAWSPDGRRLAVSRGGLPVPVEGMPGSFREETRTQVLEPRPR